MSTGPTKKEVAPTRAPRGAAGEFRPYVSDNDKRPEFTWRAIILGTLLGIVFGTSSMYLVLKIGMTVSASIPVAVLSITLFRVFAKLFRVSPPTVLENNIVQTAGSAGESIAFGVGVTMPAMMLLGFDMDPTRIMIVSLLGGLLGILMMVPLRRAFIVRLHGRAGEPGKLVYPEGTACAQVLIIGEQGGSSGRTVFFGLTLAFLHKLATEGLHLASVMVGWPIRAMGRFVGLAGELNSEYLGVGYIIGIRPSSIMMAGGVVGYLVILPTLMLADTKMGPDSPFAQIKVDDIRKDYMLHIGAGCVATAGLISMLRSLPMMLRSLKAGVDNLRGGGDEKSSTRRTDRDLPLWVVLVGSIVLVGLLMGFFSQDLGWKAALCGALLVVGFGFLFVTVSSRLTGELGSTSNPLSGMTVATLTVTCLLFLALGMTGQNERLLALTIGAVVCIAASNGGTTSQDLKTGYLLGATPVWQQVAIVIGTVSSALVVGTTLLMLNSSRTTHSTQNLPRTNLHSRLVDMQQMEKFGEKSYHIWWASHQDLADIPQGEFEKYLVDDQGTVKYRVDPGIFGHTETGGEGKEEVQKFNAPKTRVMHTIVSGVLERKLAWDKVLIGAMIALAIELCGISSLPFAVGVYLPLASTVPIFMGGVVRLCGDKLFAWRNPSSSAAERESDSSPGVLLASGYIAGGCLAGVLVSFTDLYDPIKNVLSNLKSNLEKWYLNDWFSGHSSKFALGVYLILAVILLFYGSRSVSAEKGKAAPPS